MFHLFPQGYGDLSLPLPVLALATLRVPCHLSLVGSLGQELLSADQTPYRDRDVMVAVPALPNIHLVHLGFRIVL